MNAQPLSCIVIDDEQYAIDVLTRFIEKTSALRLIRTFSDSAEALLWCMDNVVDIIFLDIEMPKITGIEFSRQMKDKAMIVICSGYAEFGVESYSHNVIDYLLKPVEYSRFLQCIQKAKDRVQKKKDIQQDSPDFILLTTEGGRNRMVKLDYKDIYYLASSKNYLHIHLRDQVVKTLTSLKEVESKLPVKRFLRIHNSYVIAIDKIQFLDNYSIVLKDCKESLPIGLTYREEVFETLNSIN